MTFYIDKVPDPEYVFLFSKVFQNDNNINNNSTRSTFRSANPIMGLSFYPSGFRISVVLTYTVVLRWHSAVPRSLHADIEKNDKNQSGDVDLTRN